MKLVGVRVELPSNSPIVLLQTAEPDDSEEKPRIVPIFIGANEATAIALAQEGVTPPRPMTHDLFSEVLTSFDVRLERVIITEIRERTFHADLHLRSASEARVVSARPSDAIALAVRMSVPIFADPALVDEVGYIEEIEEPEEMSAEVVEEFMDFIANVNPEDFAS